MKYIIQAWRYLLAEPFICLSCCFLQPSEFRRKYEAESLSSRFVLMLRLALPMFLCSYLFELVLQIILFQVLAPTSIVNFLLATARATIIGIVWGIVWGTTANTGDGITGGISAGIAIGIVGGIAGGIVTQIVRAIAGVVAGVLAGGLLESVVKNIMVRTARRIGESIGGGVAGGVVLGIVGHTVFSVIAGIVIGIIGGIMGGVVLDTQANEVGNGENLDVDGRLSPPKQIALIAAGATGGIGAGIVGGILTVFVMNLGLTTMGSITLSPMLALAFGLTLGLAGGFTIGIAIGLKLGIRLGVGLGFAWGIAFAIALTFTGSITGGVAGGIGEILAFTGSYLLSYYRLPLYPFDSLSSLIAYLASWRSPSQVFTHLHGCSLYWNECTFLPLPGLKRMLLIAAEQDVEGTLKEIAFIASQRPHQINVAREASLEIAIRDLEMRSSLRDLAKAYHRLNEILPQESGLIDARWEIVFTRVKDASRDAARYFGPFSWQIRRAALQDMIGNLEMIRPNKAFKDAELNRRLGIVIKGWLAAARHENGRLDQTPGEAGQIDNPYNPGHVLKLHDSLFVGRRDLTQKLEKALGSGTYNRTFLLNGERRMGKSSLLHQLSDLLSSRYLPIIYDLQARGVSSSIVAFFSVIAEEIYKAVSFRGIRVKKLENELLIEASRENEAAVYTLFDEWLKHLEHKLMGRECMLLLAFDEYEKLEEAEKDGYLNLPLLLNWFNNISQNNHQVALLFSGIRTFSEMRPNWKLYFVNAQTLKVSFLQPAEAYRLITRPISDFPSEQIFGEGVAEEIVRVTGCHPFLVQAVCSALIDNLNAGGRNRAEIQDVIVATDHVLESWWGTYFQNLWKRTDQAQRVCLVAIRNLDEVDLYKIVQQSGLDEHSVQCALQKLLERDLVLYERGSYRIASPIFCKWIERNSFS